MGRHHLLNLAIVPDPGPIFLPRLLLVVLTVVHGVATLTLPSPAPTSMDRLAHQEVAVLKQRILEGLGLTKVPDVSKMNVSQEEYARMYGVYLRSVEENRRRRQREMEQERLAGVTAQRFYSFTNAGHVRDRVRRDVVSRRRQNAFTWLYFPVDIPETSRSQKVDVDHASLRLFVMGLHPEEAAREGNTVEVRVYQVLQPEETEDASQFHETYVPEEGRLLVDKRRIHLAASASKWTEFDVTKAAEAWVNGGVSNLGLELECRECVRRGITLVTQETQGSNSSVSPVLNILANIHMGLNPRQKRSAIYSSDPLSNTHRSRRTECRKDGQRCCRHTMKVVFKDLEGFGFIFQPKSFDAGYCKGRCPPRYNPAHHHALLQSLIWQQDRERAPRPCCAPNKLTDLEILHQDEHDHTKLKVTIWKNIRVVECACS